jgi:ferredoxin
MGGKVKTFYFTATGNSLYVAKRIGGELYSIPKMLKEGKLEFEDEAIGIVFPCYSFGVPRMVVEFMRRAKLKSKYFFAVMTFGNISAAGLKHIENVGNKTGINFNYTNEILMVDNYLPFFKMEDQLEKEDAKRIEEKLAKISSDIVCRKNVRLEKGIFSILSSTLVHGLFNKFAIDGADKKFAVTDSCNSCGVCEKVCPKNNIRVEKKPVYLHKCEMCYACIHNCPANAIHLKSEKSKTRFINRNVSLKEIIDANS